MTLVQAGPELPLYVPRIWIHELLRAFLKHRHLFVVALLRREILLSERGRRLLSFHELVRVSRVVGLLAIPAGEARDVLRILLRPWCLAVLLLSKALAPVSELLRHGPIDIHGQERLWTLLNELPMLFRVALRLKLRQALTSPFRKDTSHVGVKGVLCNTVLLVSR